MLAALIRFLGVYGVVAVLASMPAWAGDPGAEAKVLLADAEKVLHGLQQHDQWAGMRNVIGAAQAVYIAPAALSTSLVVGRQSATGLFFRRRGHEWADPVFMEFSNFSVGLQGGVSSSQLVMIIMTDRAADGLLKGVSKFGGSGGFALADWGISGSGGGDLDGGLEVMFLSISKGIALGGGISTMKVRVRDDLQQAVYGKGYSLADIAARRGAARSPETPVRVTLEQLTKVAWGE
jgi:lipid-binding SYLF domain-containing protein